LTVKLCYYCGQIYKFILLFNLLLLTNYKMKRNILKGMIFIGAIVLGSCSTQNKLASSNNTTADDDVYFTKAKAGDEPVYAERQDSPDNFNNTYHDGSDDDADYYYYDSYAARLNRFYDDAPFLSSYYDDLYYGGYTPYYSGFGLGIGLGYGGYGGGFYGYDPYSYYGYNPYFGYGGYYGSTIGYGVSPYWGTYSYYNVARTYNNPRPYRGAGMPTISGNALGNRGTTVGYGNSVNNYPLSRPSRTSVSGSTNGVSNTSYTRPTRVQTPTPQPQPQYQPQAQPSGSNSSGGGGSSSGGGGGGRPVRP
jgi:hypothetical protein